MTNRARIHVFGGTSDALQICRALETHRLDYSLSVATEVGQELAAGLLGEIVARRMDAGQMREWLSANRISCVIDATHPFAAEASRNVLSACEAINIPCLRFERPENIDSVSDPLVIKVDSVEQACREAAKLGQTVFLTTGSKQLADYVALLPGKTLIARVLPTVSVLASCYALGLGVANIVAMKGPFSADMNLAMYRFYRPDVVITKESGETGGYREKVQPCVELGIPCIVIRRPSVAYRQVFSSTAALLKHLLDNQFDSK